MGSNLVRKPRPRLSSQFHAGNSDLRWQESRNEPVNAPLAVKSLGHLRPSGKPNYPTITRQVRVEPPAVANQGQFANIKRRYRLADYSNRQFERQFAIRVPRIGHRLDLVRLGKVWLSRVK
jgi:hypothetical protein